MSMELNSFKDLFLKQIEDLYDSERRLIKALPKMAQAANSNQLKQAIQRHLTETQEHISRLETVFRAMGLEPKRETSAAMKGLISESECMIRAKGDADIRDAAIIATAQGVEHYEIVEYSAARSCALRLGLRQAANYLQQTLDEEKAADSTLTQFGAGTVSVKAQAAAV